MAQTDIEKFDRAVYEYLMTVSEKIVYSPTQNALRAITRRERFSDKTPWNFISYYRESRFDIDWSRMNNYSTRIGTISSHTYDTVSKDTTATHVQEIPVNLTYQVELWGSKATEVQEMSTALISKIFMTDQVLEVPINPGGEDGRFHILDVSWEDNSDLERETEIGKIYRHTVSFTIDARILLVSDIIAKRFKCCNVPITIYE